LIVPELVNTSIAYSCIYTSFIFSSSAPLMVSSQNKVLDWSGRNLREECSVWPGLLVIQSNQSM